MKVLPKDLRPPWFEKWPELPLARSVPVQLEWLENWCHPEGLPDDFPRSCDQGIVVWHLEDGCIPGCTQRMGVQMDEHVHIFDMKDGGWYDEMKSRVLIKVDMETKEIFGKAWISYWLAEHHGLVKKDHGHTVYFRQTASVETRDGEWLLTYAGRSKVLCKDTDDVWYATVLLAACKEALADELE